MDWMFKVSWPVTGQDVGRPAPRVPWSNARHGHDVGAGASSDDRPGGVVRDIDHFVHAIERGDAAGIGHGYVVADLVTLVGQGESGEIDRQACVEQRSPFERLQGDAAFCASCLPNVPVCPLRACDRDDRNTGSSNLASLFIKC